MRSTISYQKLNKWHECMLGTHVYCCPWELLQTAGTSSWGWSDPPRWRWVWPRTPWRQLLNQGWTGACRVNQLKLILSAMTCRSDTHTMLHVHVNDSVGWTPRARDFLSFTTSMWYHLNTKINTEFKTQPLLTTRNIHDASLRRCR